MLFPAHNQNERLWPQHANLNGFSQSAQSFTLASGILNSMPSDPGNGGHCIFNDNNQQLTELQSSNIEK